MLIARMRDVELHIPENAWYSFYNSPYTGHRNGTAVDVYFSDEALFPLSEGKVREIRKIDPPRFVPSDEEYLMIVEISPQSCLKVLHVKPHVSVGEKLTKFDPLGKQIISGFFRPWSDRHAHFEIRNCSDPYRARGAYPLDIQILSLVPSTSRTEFVVEEKREYYYWLRPVKKDILSMTPLNYHGAGIEGGLPHYETGAVFGSLDEISLFGYRIPIRERRKKVSLFDADFSIYANGQRIKGIGAFCNQPFVKLIGGNFDEGDTISLRILTSFNGQNKA